MNAKFAIVVGMKVIALPFFVTAAPLVPQIEQPSRHHFDRWGCRPNALVGGTDNSFSVQPLSVEGETGINIATGVLKVTC